MFAIFRYYDCFGRCFIYVITLDNNYVSYHDYYGDKIDHRPRRIVFHLIFR